MVIFLYNLYIFVWIQQFWGLPKLSYVWNCLIMNHPTSIELGHLEYGLGGDPHCLQLLCKSLCTSVQDRFLCKYGKCPKFLIQNFLTKWHMQTVQTLIRLLPGAVWSGSTLFANSLSILKNIKKQKQNKTKKKVSWKEKFEILCNLL